MRKLVSGVATAAAVATAVLYPGAAYAGPFSGGGCRTQSVGGVTVDSCISYRDSSKELVGDAYMVNTGGQCIRLRLNFLVNGIPQPTFTSQDFTGPGHYPAQRISVTRNSSTQTARTTVSVNTCSPDINLGTVSSWEQRW
jgi:hypothetical protein